MVEISRTNSNGDTRIFSLYGSFKDPQTNITYVVAPIQIVLWDDSTKQVETRDGDIVGTIIEKHQGIPAATVDMRAFIYVEANLVFLQNNSVKDISQTRIAFEDIKSGMKVKLDNNSSIATIIQPGENPLGKLEVLEAIDSLDKTVKGVFAKLDEDENEFLNDSIIGSPVSVRLMNGDEKLLGMLLLNGSLENPRILIHPAEWIV